MNDRSGLFAEDGQIPLTVGKMFGKFKNIISLDTLYPNPPAGIPSYQLFSENLHKHRWTAPDSHPEIVNQQTH